MAINGIIYLIVGAFLTSFSYYVTTVNKNMSIEKFLIFIAVGIIFIIVGLFKLAAAALRRNAEKKELEKDMPKQIPVRHAAPPQAHPHYAHTQQHNPQAHHNVHHSQHSAQRTHQSQTATSIKFCPSCGAALRHFDSFCYKCGNRNLH